MKNNDLKLNNRIKQIRKSSGSDNDKNNKHLKYTLDEALEAVSEFGEESDYSIYLIRAQSEVSIQRL